MNTFVVFFCLLGLAAAQSHLFSWNEIGSSAEYTEDFGMPHLIRTTREVAVTPTELSRKRLNAATGPVVAGVTKIASNLPQYVQEGRHFWPSDFSLTRQIGLPGINLFIGDVTHYERARALAAAREASCHQRDNCLWNQRFAMVGNLFGSLSEDQKLIQNVNCDTIFAGCVHYH